VNQRWRRQWLSRDEIGGQQSSQRQQNGDQPVVSRAASCGGFHDPLLGFLCSGVLRRAVHGRLRKLPPRIFRRKQAAISHAMSQVPLMGPRPEGPCAART
jgi:hypothetical protein